MDIYRMKIPAVAAALIGFMVGLLVVGFIALAVQGEPHEVEVDVPTIICPPMIEASNGIRLYFGDIWPFPEPGPLDWEFAQACGFDTWEDPVKIIPVPPEEGGA